MISRTSNQPNFRGNLQGLLQDSETDAKFFPQNPIKLEPQTDIVMLAQISKSLQDKTATDNVQTMISDDGKTLSFSILPQFYREKVGDPFAHIPIESHDHNTLAEQQLRRHNDVQLIRYSLSQEEYRQGYKGMQESAETLLQAFRLQKDKEDFFKNVLRPPSLKTRLLSKVQDYANLNTLKCINRLGNFQIKKIIQAAAPKVDRAKIKSFFRF